jgi:multisubunit Na+/H+ antiporter MnhF subunit
LGTSSAASGSPTGPRPRAIAALRNPRYTKEPQISRRMTGMRSFEIIAGLVVALILFVVLKVIGLVIKFALIAALLGFVVGLLIARSFRSKTG